MMIMMTVLVMMVMMLMMMMMMVMGTVRYDILSLKPGNQREAEDPKKSDLLDVSF